MAHHHNFDIVEVDVEDVPRNKCLACLKSNTLTIATVTGVVLGAIIGIILRETKEEWTEREIMYIGYIGAVFLQMLKSLILPLIISSLVSAIASLDLSLSGKIAARAIAYYLTTTFAAVVLGMILVVSIRPGANHNEDVKTNSTEQSRNVTTVDTLLDLVNPEELAFAARMSYVKDGKRNIAEAIKKVTTGSSIFVRKVKEDDHSHSKVKQYAPEEALALIVDTKMTKAQNMFPPNLIEACIFQYRTNLVPPDDSETDVYKFNLETETVQNTNILGLVVASAVIGIAIAQLGEEAKTLANFFHNLMALMMKITTWVIWLSPVGIMFLVAAEILQMENIVSVMSSLGLYFVTVCVGLLLQGFVVLPLLYYALTRKNPITFVTNMGQAIATAFGTASSSATLPVTIRCLEDNLGIDRRVARFALPIGATINMDGTALYEAVAAIFIAQVRNVPMDIGTLVAISITATAASIGAAGIPQAGLVTMVMVLDTVGLPAEDVSLILAVDWLLDRFRTAINVMGDAFGAGIVNHRSQKELVGLKQETPRNSIDDKKNLSIGPTDNEKNLNHNHTTTTDESIST
ncbi:hypothetical protein NQ314_010192 [Rhamnusium bicolor]|uniref:Amino acid transporter n=1 Tax=Rhamnusium bicolor TaxID=1586634 RepID=A0AAV8XU66_9CUCU|nr:hypothetical protein NQ314_010192 [Rhamnusium bicolor]